MSIAILPLMLCTLPSLQLRGGPAVAVLLMKADVSRCKAPHAASDEYMAGEDTPKGPSIFRETSCS